ncbi:MAG: argininosuccinate synthase [Nannocystaceae bacterium]
MTLQYERGRCVAIDGAFASPLELMQRANVIGGRHGLGLASALENRIIGTKSRGVYEAPGMELLATGLRAVYQSVLDRRATALFGQMSRLVADATYDGRLFDPAARRAPACIDVLAEPASGTVELGLYKGNAFVQAIRDVGATLYNPADASMEASDGLDPRSNRASSRSSAPRPSRSRARGRSVRPSASARPAEPAARAGEDRPGRCRSARSVLTAQRGAGRARAGVGRRLRTRRRCRTDPSMRCRSTADRSR